jgi:hypothetical protein
LTGRYNRPAAVDTMVSAYTAAVAAFSSTRTAIPTATKQRSDETMVRTTSRRHRSARADANGASAADGSILSSEMSPTAAAPPCWKA